MSIKEALKGYGNVILMIVALGIQLITQLQIFIAFMLCIVLMVLTAEIGRLRKRVDVLSDAANDPKEKTE